MEKIIFHGSPCQDFSIAGKGKGGVEGTGTRSSLMWHTVRLVEQEKPKYVIWENVKAVLNKNHKETFNKYLTAMEELGYTDHYQIMNAKDYGIPQNRDRVFTVSILGNETFNFPPKQELNLRLKDMLEDEVDEKYYLSDKAILGIQNSSFISKKNIVQNENSFCSTLLSRDYKDPKCIKIKNATNKYCEYCNKQLVRKRFNGRLEDFNVFKNRKYCNRECMKRSFLKVGENEQTYSNAHTTARKINELLLHKEECELCGSKNNLDIHHIDGNWQNNNLDNLMCLCRSCHNKEHRNGNEEYRIRKLTPLEVWRLMGFDDDDFYKAQEVNSNSQLYKQAGNSIVVNVLEHLFNALLDHDKEYELVELFGGIGSPRKALTRQGFNFKVLDYVEIDKYAVKSYNAMYNENYEPQDITKYKMEE